MKKLLLVSIMVIGISCTGLRTINFITFKEGKKVRYKISAPAWYRKLKFKDDHGKKQYIFLYRDSSVIYITDNIKSGGTNKEKVKKYGEGVNLKIIASDTLILQGVTKDKYWKEIKKGNIVVGYINASNEKHALYDSVLQSLKSN